MKTKYILNIVRPYCKKIVFNNKHYKAYLKNNNGIVVIASTSSDHNFHWEVIRQFRKYGVIIKL